MDDACRERNEGAAAECSFHGDRCNFFSSTSSSSSSSSSTVVLPLARLLSLLVFSQSERASLAREMTYDIFLRGFLPGRALSGGPLCVCLGDDVAPKKTREPGIKSPRAWRSFSRVRGATDNLHFSTINLTSRRCRFFCARARARSEEFLARDAQAETLFRPAIALPRAAFLKYRGGATSSVFVYGRRRSRCV